MRFWILAILCLTGLASATSEGQPAAGPYHVTGGGITHSTCPSEDPRPVSELPWWGVQPVGTSGLNIHQIPGNSSGVGSEQLWGNIALNGGSYGLYEGTGWMVERNLGPNGPCSRRRDISAQINSIDDGTLILTATVKFSLRNPDFEARACEVYQLTACEVQFSYDLSQVYP